MKIRKHNGYVICGVDIIEFAFLYFSFNLDIHTVFICVFCS